MITSPRYFFSELAEHPDFPAAVAFFALTSVIVFIETTLLSLFVPAYTMAFTPANILGFIAVYAVVVLVFLLGWAWLVNGMLRMLGGRGTFTQTLSIYLYGSVVGLLSPIPVVQWIGLIFGAVLLVTGLNRIHKIHPLKSIMTLLTTFLLALLVGAFILMLVLAPIKKIGSRSHLRGVPAPGNSIAAEPLEK